MANVLANIRSRVERLHASVANGDNTVGIIQCRLDNLCRDILLYRECLPRYEEISTSILSAKHIIDDEVTDTNGHAVDAVPRVPKTVGGVGRPKYIITEEQLRFFIGEYIYFFMKLLPFR